MTDPRAFTTTHRLPAGRSPAVRGAMVSLFGKEFRTALLRRQLRLVHPAPKKPGESDE